MFWLSCPYMFHYMISSLISLLCFDWGHTSPESRLLFHVCCHRCQLWLLSLEWYIHTSIVACQNSCGPISALQLIGHGNCCQWAFSHTKSGGISEHSLRHMRTSRTSCRVLYQWTSFTDMRWQEVPSTVNIALIYSRDGTIPIPESELALFPGGWNRNRNLISGKNWIIRLHKINCASEPIAIPRLESGNTDLE